MDMKPLVKQLVLHHMFPLSKTEELMLRVVKQLMFHHMFLVQTLHEKSKGSCLHHRSQPQKLWMITVVKQLVLHDVFQATNT